jgi:L-lactate permease
VLYPFFGTLLGWLGVALTGSDTASNILFGNLQKITSEQLGLSPILMAAANSSGGVMGKMIDAQSIVVPHCLAEGMTPLLRKQLKGQETAAAESRSNRIFGTF